MDDKITVAILAVIVYAVYMGTNVIQGTLAPDGFVFGTLLTFLGFCGGFKFGADLEKKKIIQEIREE